jgi:transposase
MNGQRFVITDQLWQRIEPHLPGKVGDAGATAKDNRLFLEAVFWRMRTGSPWRDLPPAFGNWNSQFRWFRRWAMAGVFERLFKAMSCDPDFDMHSLTALLFRSTRRQPAQKGTKAQAIGSSRGGLRPRSWHWWMRSVIWCASRYCRDKRMI